MVNDERKVIGMVTDRDICIAAATRAARPSDIRIRDVMSGDVAACGITDDIRSRTSLNERLQALVGKRVEVTGRIDPEGGQHRTTTGGDRIRHPDDSVLRQSRREESKRNTSRGARAGKTDPPAASCHPEGVSGEETIVDAVIDA